MNAFGVDPAELAAVLQSKRFLAVSRAKVDVNAIGTWDDNLLRDMRLLVPVDVQALVVPQGGDEPMLRLPMLVAGDGVDDPSKGMPPPFAAGQARPAGVHLHWAMPDALLRGRLEQRDDGASNRLSLPQLPDRWVVLRIVLPAGGGQPAVRGWVLEADRAVAVPLEQWSEGSAASQAATPAGQQVQPGDLTGTVGGSITWSAVYDAVVNRFAFHDPLADLAADAPNGVDRNGAAYLVAGWWSQPAADPLDSARSSASLGELLDGLGWRLLADFGDAGSEQQQRASDQTLRAALGLTTGSRFPVAEAAATTQKGISPLGASVARPEAVATSSKFAAEAARVFRAEPWHLRSTLLHGAVYGVPLARPRRARRTPGRRQPPRLPRPARRRRARRARVASRTRPRTRAATSSGCSPRSPPSGCRRSARPTASSRPRSTSTTRPSGRCPAGSRAPTGSSAAGATGRSPRAATPARRP